MGVQKEFPQKCKNKSKNSASFQTKTWVRVSANWEGRGRPRSEWKRRFGIHTTQREREILTRTVMSSILMRKKLAINWNPYHWGMGTMLMVVGCDQVGVGSRGILSNSIRARDPCNTTYDLPMKINTNSVNCTTKGNKESYLRRARKGGIGSGNAR